MKSEQCVICFEENGILESVTINTFVPPSDRYFILNLALIGQAVSEKKIFENGGRHYQPIL